MYATQHRSKMILMSIEKQQQVQSVLKMHFLCSLKGSKTLVHKLHEKQLEVFINFLACFIKPEHLKMSPKKLLELDLANNTLHSQIYVGKVAEDLIAAHPKHPVSILNKVNYFLNFLSILSLAVQKSSIP